MSIVNDLRAKAKAERTKQEKEFAFDSLTRSTQEQLRLNHIETLEVLEEAVQENIKLKAEISELKSQISSTPGVLSAAATSTVMDEVQLIELLKTKDNDLKDIRNKLSACEINLSDQRENSRNQISREIEKRKQIELEAGKKEKQLSERISALTVQLDEYKSLALEFDNMTQFVQTLKSAGEDQAKMYAERIHESTGTAEEASMKLASLEKQLEQVSALLLDRSSAAIQLVNEKKELVGAIERRVNEHNAKQDEFQRELTCLQTRFEDAMEELSTMKQQLSAYQTMEQQTVNEVNAAAHFSTDICPSCQRPWKDTLAPGTSTSSTSAAITTFLQPAPTPPANDDDENEQQEGDETTIEGKAAPGGRLFEEFVKLKKENRSLKLQLSDLTSVQPHVRSAAAGISCAISETANSTSSTIRNSASLGQLYSDDDAASRTKIDRTAAGQNGKLSGKHSRQPKEKSAI